MRITKSTISHEHMVVASSSSNDDDVSLGANIEKAPAGTYDVASFSVVPQCRGGVPS